MNLLSLFKTTNAIAAGAAVFLLAGQALAQDNYADGAPPDDDGARFRGAIQAEGGALAVPGDFTLGFAGVSGQLGAQINHLVGVYAVPQLDVVFGDLGGVKLGGAVVVDFTFADMVSVGAGPDIAIFGAIGASNSSVSGAGGEMYGGRLHLGFYPDAGRGDDGIRRKAFALGFDLRMMAGAIGSATVSTTGSSADATNFIIIPQLTLGYQAF